MFDSCTEIFKILFICWNAPFCYTVPESSVPVTVGRRKKFNCWRLYNSENSNDDSLFLVIWIFSVHGSELGVKLVLRLNSVHGVSLHGIAFIDLNPIRNVALSVFSWNMVTEALLQIVDEATAFQIIEDQLVNTLSDVLNAMGTTVMYFIRIIKFLIKYSSLKAHIIRRYWEVRSEFVAFFYFKLSK